MSTKIDQIETLALRIVAKELALTVSNLALKLKEKLGEDPTQLGNALRDLEQQNKVKVRKMGGDDELITITAHGIKELEKASTGIASQLSVLL